MSLTAHRPPLPVRRHQFPRHPSFSLCFSPSSVPSAQYISADGAQFQRGLTAAGNSGRLMLTWRPNELCQVLSIQVWPSGNHSRSSWPGQQEFFGMPKRHMPAHGFRSSGIDQWKPAQRTMKHWVLSRKTTRCSCIALTSQHISMQTSTAPKPDGRAAS